MYYVMLFEGQVGVVRVLQNAGADLFSRNSQQDTPLDCAIRNGRESTVRELLRSGAPVEPKGTNITTPLHRAARERHSRIITVLLRAGAQPDRIDENLNTCLDIAIDNKDKKCCLAILNSDQWESVLRASKNTLLTTGQTPLRLLIRNIPEVAEVLLRKCYETHGKSDENDYKISCLYEYLDDVFVIREHPLLASFQKKQPILWRFLHCFTSGRKSNEMAVGCTKPVAQLQAGCPYDENDKLKAEASLYTDDLDKVVDNHPLKIMVDCKRLSLLKNPVVSYLIRHKWNSVGRYIYYTGLSIYFLFLLLLTHYITERAMPITTTSNIASISTVQPDNTINENNHKLQPQRSNDYSTLTAFVILFLALLQLLKEGFQLYQRGNKYFTFENFYELIVLFAAISAVLEVNGYVVFGIGRDSQWVIGGFAVFISWINLLFMIRKLPKFGIYILMFFDVVSTFLQSIVVFGLFVVAFSMLFFIWLQNRAEFQSRWLSVMKTTMMMIGEVDYVTMFFDDDNSSAKNQSSTNPWANIALFAFVIIMTILLMNLLVGLAVDDIKAVQEKAELTRIAMHIELILDVEKVWHMLSMYGMIGIQCRQRLTIRKQHVFPNRKSWIGKVVKWFGSYGTNKQDGTADLLVEETDSITQLSEEISDIQEKLLSIKRFAEENSAQQLRLKASINAIMKHLEIQYEDNDDILFPDS